MKLSDILATDQLFARAAALPPIQEGAASALPITLKRMSHLELIRLRCDEAMQECGAQSAGVTVFNDTSSPELTWLAATGVAKSFEGRRFPQRHSLCDVSFDRRAPQLFIEAQSYFLWMGEAGLRVREALVVPLRSPNGKFFGALWIMQHDAGVQFTQQDVERLDHLATGVYALVCGHNLATKGEQCLPGSAVIVAQHHSRQQCRTRPTRVGR